MQSTTKISCRIGTTNTSAPLSMEIWLDDQKQFDQIIAGTVDCECEVNEDQADHLLKFVMKNKTNAHTQIDSDGNIINDARLTVENVAFEGIVLGQLFLDQAVYIHDFNGTQPQIDDKFFGEMGCNGELKLCFTTPVYLWLLDNM